MDDHQPAHAEGEGGVAAVSMAVAAPATTRVVLERDLSPLDRLDPGARRRLLVRVLCELVAYDAAEPAATPERLAG
jgi:hypothetical protein